MKASVYKLLSVAMVIALILAGCGGKNNSNSGASSSPPASPSASSASPSASATPEPVKEGPHEVTWMSAYLPGENSMVQKILEEKYNLKITTVGIDRANWQQQVNIKLASGVKPDIFGQVDGGYPDFLNYVKQGLIGEIPIEKIRQYAPNFSKMVDEVDKSAWDIGIIDGKNYGIPKFYGEGGSPFIPAYNADWLKAIGYDAPPKTLEELEDVLTKFRNDDPDGNKKKDTYGISARGKDTLGSNQIFNTVFAAHGAHASGWIVTADGKVEFGITSEKARAAFKVLNRWYKNQLIDPEFVTDDWNAYRAKFANGKIGMLDQALWYHDHISGQVGADAAAAGMNMVIGTPVIGPEGKMIGVTQGFKQSPYGLGVETVKDEKKLEAILTMLDDLAMNLEMYMLVQYGKEGEHYDLVDGAPVRKPAFVDPIQAAAAAGINFFVFNPQTPQMIQNDYSAEKVAFKEGVNKPEITRMSDAMQLRILPSFDANRDALVKMLREYELKFITGEVDLDQGFDNFVAEMNKIGLAQATVEANEIYANASK